MSEASIQSAEPASESAMPQGPTISTEPVADPWSLPLAELNPVRPEIFQQNKLWGYFERLRKEDPVHYTADSEWGPYWSLTRYADITQVDTDHDRFSSESGGITIGPPVVLREQAEEFRTPMFIAMDRPRHDEQRATVSPVVGPRNLAQLEQTIRGRAAKILDSLPVGEEFDWVDNVSIELTTQMLATLFGFPFEERRKLTRWSDVATAAPGAGVVDTIEQRREELLECLAYFTELWKDRQQREPGNDLVSMLAHGESTRHLDPMEFLGNLILLIVGGNDTTRNSITGGVLALNQFPDQYQKLRNDPSLIAGMVPEIIRWQTPLAYMRRTANEDVEIGGKTIRAGDAVLMWYISGNRDPDEFDRADELIIDRPNARRHVAFGFGIHRCMGNRVAEMQLRVLWEEIMKRFKTVEVMAEPERVPSSFVKGYRYMPVKLEAI